MTKDEQIIVPRVRTDLLCESIEHLKLTPSKQEFAKAVLRRAVEYAAMREAGLVPMSDQEPVAWLITWRDGETAVWMEKPIPNPEITVQPLYLGAAQAAPEPAPRSSTDTTDLLRNIAGLDDSNLFISSHAVLVNAVREWRDEARKLLSGGAAQAPKEASDEL
jgi:hypothetical protein